MHERTKCVQYLLQVCPHLIYKLNTNNYNHFHLAILQNRLDIIPLLVHCDPTKLDTSTFNMAIAKGSLESVNLLKQLCPTFNQKRIKTKFVIPNAILKKKKNYMWNVKAQDTCFCW